MAILCFALAYYASAQLQPPLDPTYGWPLPHLSANRSRGRHDAEWIWTKETRDKQTVYCRHKLTFGKTPKAARLYVTVDNYFNAYVNGREVGSTVAGQDGMGWSKVRVYDVASLLKPGANQICIEGINAGGPGGVLARLEADGKPVLLSDGTWKVTDFADAVVPNAWTSVGFDDSTWQKATEEAAAGEGPWSGQLAGWPVELESAAWYLAHLKLPPKQVSIGLTPANWTATDETVTLTRPAAQSGPWTAIIDFGKELPGRAVLSAQKPLAVKVGTGESAEEALYGPWKTVELSLGKQPGYTPYTALRYVAVTLSPDVVFAKIDVSFDHLYYPVEYKGSFDCSDPLLTKVWYTGAYTAHSCMQEDIWDAPKRDRARWMGDLHVSGEVINNAFLDKFLMEQTMDRLRKDAQGGRPPTALPSSNVNGIPGYSCAWIAGLADFYRHVGDLAYLKSQHQALITMLEYMRGEIGDDGIFANRHGQWPFVDWAPEFNGDSPQARAATHLFFVKAVKEAVFLFQQLGDTGNAEAYGAWERQLTEAAQAHLAGPAGAFGDRRQENAMAIYSGVATHGQIASIYKSVLAPDSPAWNYVATPYYNNYILDAITQAGHMEDAMRFVRGYWGEMIKEGATTFWEGYDPRWDRNNIHAHLQADNGTGYFVSLCHGWSAGATNWLTERVLGVRSTGAGFATCVIEPNLGDLTWAAGTVPTPHGPLKVRVAKVGSSYKLTVTVPSGVAPTIGSRVMRPGTHTVELPAHATPISEDP